MLSSGVFDVVTIGVCLMLSNLNTPGGQGVLLLFIPECSFLGESLCMSVLLCRICPTTMYVANKNGTFVYEVHKLKQRSDSSRWKSDISGRRRAVWFLCFSATYTKELQLRKHNFIYFQRTGDDITHSKPVSCVKESRYKMINVWFSCFSATYTKN